MSPFQHGEVFVTDDGTETDLDLGHYERFTSMTATKDNNFTTGKIYAIGDREGAPRRLPRRDGPGHPAHHRRDQASRSSSISDGVDIQLVEIGGTVGDIESLPFLEAIRQFRLDVGPRERDLHPPDAGALHRRRRRAEDQADAALGPRAARDRHPARHPALPQRPRRCPPRSSARSRCSATSARTR